MAAMEQITFDEEGNCIARTSPAYLIPTAWETPKFELGETVTPSPHRDRHRRASASPRPSAPPPRT